MVIKPMEMPMPLITEEEVAASLEEASKHYIKLVEAVLATAQVQCP